ncbi:hypothetical protein [Burkholderia gladioli]|uniref:hypothetical protein n=1 Tax=Burkholderia gladioli TaxID=28095 RepID=UPI00163EC4A2|nr:hypothetical protein [Burkholderia gladioli]
MNIYNTELAAVGKLVVALGIAGKSLRNRTCTIHGNGFLGAPVGAYFFKISPLSLSGVDI